MVLELYLVLTGAMEKGPENITILEFYSILLSLLYSTFVK